MIPTTPGRLTTATAEGAPLGILGTLGVKLTDSTGATVLGRTTDGIVIAAVNGETADYAWEFEAPETGLFYRVVWDHGAIEFDELVVVTGYAPAGATFASIDDLAIRLGYASGDDLSTVKQAQGALLLDIATGLIADAAGHDSAWAVALSPIPGVLRAVCLEMCARVMTNPGGVRSESETLGVHQHAVSYSDGASGLYLTDWEMRLVRTAAGGSGRATTIPGTTVDLLVELRDTGEIAGFPAE